MAPPLGAISSPARAAMRPGPRPIASAATKWAATEAIRTRVAGRARAAPTQKCAGIAMNEPSREPRTPRGATLSLGLSMLAAALAALGAPSCLERRDQPTVDAEVAQCTSCHGDANRPGDSLLRSAPPKDLGQQTLPGY